MIKPVAETRLFLLLLLILFLVFIVTYNYLAKKICAFTRQSSPGFKHWIFSLPLFVADKKLKMENFKICSI